MHVGRVDSTRDRTIRAAISESIAMRARPDCERMRSDSGGLLSVASAKGQSTACRLGMGCFVKPIKLPHLHLQDELRLRHRRSAGVAAGVGAVSWIHSGSLSLLNPHERSCGSTGNCGRGQQGTEKGAHARGCGAVLTSTLPPRHRKPRAYTKGGRVDQRGTVRMVRADEARVGKQRCTFIRQDRTDKRAAHTTVRTRPWSHRSSRTRSAAVQIPRPGQPSRTRPGLRDDRGAVSGGASWHVDGAVHAAHLHAALRMKMEGAGKHPPSPCVHDVDSRRPLAAECKGESRREIGVSESDGNLADPNAHAQTWDGGSSGMGCDAGGQSQIAGSPPRPPVATWIEQCACSSEEARDPDIVLRYSTVLHTPLPSQVTFHGGSTWGPLAVRIPASTHAKHAVFYAATQHCCTAEGQTARGWSIPSVRDGQSGFQNDDTLVQQHACDMRHAHQPRVSRLEGFHAPGMPSGAASGRESRGITTADAPERCSLGGGRLIAVEVAICAREMLLSSEMVSTCRTDCGCFAQRERCVIRWPVAASPVRRMDGARARRMAHGNPVADHQHRVREPLVARARYSLMRITLRPADNRTCHSAAMRVRASTLWVRAEWRGAAMSRVRLRGGKACCGSWIALPYGSGCDCAPWMPRHGAAILPLLTARRTAVFHDSWWKQQGARRAVMDDTRERGTEPRRGLCGASASAQMGAGMLHAGVPPATATTATATATTTATRQYRARKAGREG
ncbi:hypothetical protein MRB53_038055 [Persea americana]|nr:hypothetical protein MRB53_038055 [Persea americana]